MALLLVNLFSLCSTLLTSFSALQSTADQLDLPKSGLGLSIFARRPSERRQVLSRILAAGFGARTKHENEHPK
ncbi:hypothetical protein EV421DRAFT_138235 [Armillaria borealis]|uniref:Secreted protein n=1 Tax=Armillaria borealis TaxID=47425 RepID=A0AA39IWF1_9AGAR|nr:hypothetical protein EV421DRAFT_138235 [Armillaria borealis]